MLLINQIAYIDIEVIVNSQNISKIGLLYGDVDKSTTSLTDVRNILERHNPDFLCGHNFIDHDKRFLLQSSLGSIVSNI